MASPLARRVAHAIRRRALWTADDRVAVAVSGGADSVALARLLSELAAGSPSPLAGLIHVNHGLRGAESDADEAFCRTLSADLGVPIDVVRVDVVTHAARERRSLESSARELRYAAFEAAATRLSATVVVTGHTADDQAETVLLRLFRGAGMRGVSAIRWRRGRYARPLLGERRETLRAYMDEMGASFRDDSSNLDVSIPRNRLRHGLMARIASDWPGAVLALARFAELAAEDERTLSAEAAASGARILSPLAGVELQRGVVTELPPAVGRRVIRDAIEEAGGRATTRDIAAIWRVSRSARQRGRLVLHRLRVELNGDVLRLAAPQMSRAIAGEYELPVPGNVLIRETATTIRASLIQGADRPEVTGRSAVLQLAELNLPLTVRGRRPGDRFHPLGAPGTRKVQDVLVDRKVPADARDEVPVVVDRLGQIVWVAGLAIAHRCRVTRPEAGMVKLDLEKKDNQ
ncbi:MAG: tRNA lysidine(34) synthetase TilS [Acidobacteriota bacterium]